MSVYQEIQDERDRQDQKWGGPQHDDRHSPGDFADFIIERMTWPELSNDTRKAFVQAAALAVAAIESWDRRA